MTACTYCFLGHIEQDDGSYTRCAACAGTGSREVARDIVEFRAGYLASIWLDDDET